MSLGIQQSNMETLSSTTTIWNLIISSTTTVWVCQSSSVSVWDLGWTNSSTVLWCWRHLWVWQCVELTIQLRLGGAGDTIGSGNSAQFGSGNSIRTVLATPLDLAIQLSLGGAGDTIGYGNTDKFGSGNSIQFQFGSENTYLYQ